LAALLGWSWSSVALAPETPAAAAFLPRAKQQDELIPRSSPNQAGAIQQVRLHSGGLAEHLRPHRLSAAFFSGHASSSETEKAHNVRPWRLYCA